MRPFALVFTLATACSAVVSAPSTPSTPTPPATTPPVTTPLGACVGARGGDAPVIALMNAGATLTLLANGRTRALHSFGDGAAGESQVQSRDGFALVHASVGRVPQYNHRIALVDVQGRVRWQENITVTQTSTPFRMSARPASLHLGAGGMVAIHLLSWPDRAAHSSTLVLTPDGRRYEIDDRSPMTAPDASGRLRVRGTATDLSDAAWWSPSSGLVSRPSRPGEVVTPPWDFGDMTVSYVTAPDGIYLSRERGGREARVRLNFVTATHQIRATGTPPAPWLLLSSASEPEQGVVHRLNLETMAMTTMQVQLPAGMRATAYSHGPGIDRDGALLAAYRDDDWAQLLRSEDGVRWQPIGRPTTGAFATLLGDHHHGSYVITATNARYGGDEWPERVRDEPTGLRGDSLQISRPAEGVSLVLRDEDSDTFEPDSVSLSPNGLCGAWISRADDQFALRVVDVRTGAVHATAIPITQSGGYTSFAWWR